MNIEEFKNRLKRIYKANIPVFLWGGAGIGKSSAIKQVAEELNIECIDIRLSLLDPSDLRGLPRFRRSSETVLLAAILQKMYDMGIMELTEGEIKDMIFSDKASVEWTPPNFLPIKGKGFLFLDEFNQSTELIQKASLQLILDRKIGEYSLPDGWLPICAGNRREDGALVRDRLEAPLEDRFQYYTIEPDFSVWKKWAYMNDIHEDILAFLSTRPDYLYKFDPKRTSKMTSPRGWERTSKLLKVGLDSFEDIAGSIGEGVATEFIAFRNLRKELPDIKAILRGESVEMPGPDKIDIVHFTIQACLAAIKKSEKKKKPSIGFFKWLRQVNEVFGAELVTVGVKDYAMAFPDYIKNIMGTQEYKETVKIIGDVIFG
ncbi:MAG: hypothetical protein N2V75_00300 [Methanophagales archaeon]|nr:hypothetical protein [Methanophagales archaeon]